MAERIAVMNDGIIEQFGPPQEIYDRPATLFVADFIGSPPMNFISFTGAARPRRPGDPHRWSRARQCRSFGKTGRGRARPRRAAGACAPVRATAGCAERCMASEYLGTTQIVTVRTARGQVRARLARGTRACRRGEPVGLTLKPEKLSIFDGATGRAIRTRPARGRAAAMAKIEIDRSRSASRTSRPSPTCRSPSRTASSSSSSGRPAPARRRPCASSPASNAPTRERSASTMSIGRAPIRRCATSPSCSSNTRSIRTFPSTTTSPSRCARRCVAWPRMRNPRARDGDRPAPAHR